MVPCETCGRPTAMTGTKRCDGCWEVEHRLRDYLGHEAGRALVKRLLDAVPVEVDYWERPASMFFEIDVRVSAADRTARVFLVEEGEPSLLLFEGDATEAGLVGSVVRRALIPGAGDLQMVATTLDALRAVRAREEDRNRGR